MCTRRSSAESAASNAEQDSLSSQSRLNWTEAEEVKMIDYLVDYKAEAGDGANFKKSVWNAVSVHMGRRWIGDKCRTKWGWVCQL